jgi:hypothetical protein
MVVAEVEKTTRVEDDREYLAFVSDGCSCPLNGDDCDVKFVTEHLGPLPAPKPRKLIDIYGKKPKGKT